MEEETRSRRLHRHSFILTAWLEGGATSGAPPTWRFSLEDPRTQERRGFREPAELADFLRTWTGDAERGDGEG